MTPIRGLLTALTLLTLGTATLVGCSATTGGDAGKPPPSPDAAGLNPANYPTTPRPDLGKAGEEGIYVEARRMGDFVVMPFQVDPTLTAGGGIFSFNGAIKSAESAGSALELSVPPGAANNFVTGFAVQRDNEGTFATHVQNMVLRYRDPAAALAAVNELATKGKKKPLLSGDPDPVTRGTDLPGHPESRAITWQSYDNPKVLAYTAHGPYVLIQQTVASTLDAATRLAASALEKQKTLIDKFKPTPADQLAELPMDPNGLLARTVEPPPDLRSRIRFGLYGVQGFLAFSDDPAGDEKILNDAGVTEVSLLGTDVYRARDAAGAEQIVTAWADIREKTWDPTDGLPGLENSRCFKQETKPGTDDARTLYACLYAVDNNAVDVVAYQKANMRQQAAAQYLLLTAE